jgi:uncharacterized protein (DUF952 family)
VILHICTRDEWALAAEEGAHRPASLASEGFVHCSDVGTVHLVGNARFAGRTDLVLLVVDPDQVGAPVRWEPGADLPGPPWFPHVYGPIPVHAVHTVLDWPTEPDGTFRPPAELTHPE